MLLERQSSLQELYGIVHVLKRLLLTMVSQGSGIGSETARAFATAGAKRVILIGCTGSKLEETAVSLPYTASAIVHCVLSPMNNL